MNNLPKVVTQQRHGRASNPRLLDRKSDALPLSHRARLQTAREAIIVHEVGTLAVDGWDVTFGTARRGLGGAAARPAPSSLYQMQQPIHQRPVYQSPYCCIMIRCSAVLMCP